MNVGLGIPNVAASDTDDVYFTYSIINSSAGASKAEAFLSNAGSGLLNAVEKADEAAIKFFFGVDLSGLSPQEAGALIGAQIGGTILPGWGSVIGAIAGWFADTLPGFIFPDCDGPVAIGLFVFSGAQLKSLTQAAVHIQTDEHHGANSASGCGSNSDYQVTWNVANVTNLG